MLWGWSLAWDQILRDTVIKWISLRSPEPTQGVCAGSDGSRLGTIRLHSVHTEELCRCLCYTGYCKHTVYCWYTQWVCVCFCLSLFTCRIPQFASAFSLLIFRLFAWVARGSGLLNLVRNTSKCCVQPSNCLLAPLPTWSRKDKNVFGIKYLELSSCPFLSQQYSWNLSNMQMIWTNWLAAQPGFKPKTF